MCLRAFAVICCKRHQNYSKRKRTLCFSHTLQWGLSNYLVEIPGVFASFCRDLLQAPKLFQKDANFLFLAHFAVRSFELLGRNTRCACLRTFAVICCKRQNCSKRMRTLCFLHTLQWGLSNYLVEMPGVFASFCRDLLQAPKLFQKDANFLFLAHFAVRSFELLGRNARCACLRTFAVICCKRQNCSKRMRTLCFLHTLQWGLSNYLVEMPGVFANFCRDLLQEPKLF